MKNLIPIAQAQNQIAQLLLAQAGVTEYKADWLTNAKTVTRDTSGRFASKASQIKTDVTKSVGSVSEQLKRYTKDPELAKHAINTKLIELTGKGLEKLVDKNPEFANKLTELMFGVDAQKTRDRLAELYAEVNPGLPNAIKPNPVAEITDDIKGLKKGRDPKELAKDLGRAFELAGYKYNKLIDDLNHVESESEAIKTLGKVAATSIPIAAYLAATLAPEIAIGLLAQDTLASILVSAAATQAVAFGANKAMDQADVKNPWFRLGIDLAIGVGVGGTVSTGVKQLEKRAFVKAKAVRKAAEVAEAEAKVAKAASQKIVKKPEIHSAEKFKDVEIKFLELEYGTSSFSTCVIDNQKYFLKTRGGYEGEVRAVTEEMAYDIGRTLGIEKHLIPTASRKIGNELFTASHFVEQGEILKGGSQKIASLLDKVTLTKCALFDFVTANSDRNASNFLIDGDGILKLIDHEYCFYVFSDFQGYLIGALSKITDDPEVLSEAKNILSLKTDILSLMKDKKYKGVNWVADIEEDKKRFIKIVEKRFEKLEKAIEMKSLKSVCKNA